MGIMHACMWYRDIHVFRIHIYIKWIVNYKNDKPLFPFSRDVQIRKIPIMILFPCDLSALLHAVLGEDVLWEGTQCFAENRYLRGLMVFRKNINRTLQTMRKFFCIAMPSKASLVFAGLRCFLLVSTLPWEIHQNLFMVFPLILTSSTDADSYRLGQSLVVSAGSCHTYWFVFWFCYWIWFLVVWLWRVKCPQEITSKQIHYTISLLTFFMCL